MRVGFTSHRKFLRLAQMVGDDVRALGHVEFLWQKAYQNATAFLGDAVDVELAAHWRGEPGLLLRHLLECGGEGKSGLVDRVDGGYAVHDLWDHAPDYVRRRRVRENHRSAKGDRLARPVTDRSLAVQRPAGDRSMVRLSLGEEEEPSSLGKSFYSGSDSQDPAPENYEPPLERELGAAAPSKPGNGKAEKHDTPHAKVFAVFDGHDLPRPSGGLVACWIRDVGEGGTLEVLAELGRDGLGRGETFVTGAVRKRLAGFRGKNTLQMGPRLSQSDADDLDQRMLAKGRAARGGEA